MCDVKTEIVFKKYEAICRSIEYLDSYVTKILGVYAIFAGFVVSNTGILFRSRLLSAVFIALVTTIAYLMLSRISRLIDMHITSVRAIEEQLASTSKDPQTISTFPDLWGRGLSTSKVARWGIVSIGLFSTIAVFFV
ncbi:MAG: hypothetical protein AAFX76_05255 [Planctomycetota bacterium]